MNEPSEKGGGADVPSGSALLPPLDLDLDLLLLETHQRFETFCLRLAKREFPRVMAIAGAWDRGRDLALYTYLHDYMASKEGGGPGDGDVIWQCKFVRRLDSTAKKSILESIAAVEDHHYVPVTRWILCVPVDPTEPFMQWLREQVEPRGWQWEVWGRRTLLEKLSAHSDLVETFFYPVYEQLRRHFAIEKLELFSLRLDDECAWRQRDPNVLAFSTKGDHDPDLVFDLIVENSDTMDAVLMGIQVQVVERESDPHGLPGQGLLFSQITYCVPINHGQAGQYRVQCEPPLVVRAGSKERFKIRLADTGYAWMGTVRILLDYGKGRLLPLPMMRLYT